MSILHSPRTPWLMLAIFCVAALLLLVTAAGRDLGLIGDMKRSSETAAVKREIRMPIVIDKPASARPAIKRSTSPDSTASPGTPEERPKGVLDHPSDKTLQPETQGTEPESAGTLLSHRFQPNDKRFEALFHTDQPVKGTRVFFKSSPALWVVDLHGNWKNAARRVSTFEQGAIDRVVIGEHDRYLRVVFRYRDRETPMPDEPPLITEEERGFNVVIE